MKKVRCYGPSAQLYMNVYTPYLETGPDLKKCLNKKH